MASRRPAVRRLNAVDVIEGLQATIRNLTERHTASSPQVAIDLTRNAKGDTQIGVKVTANMDADARRLKAHAAAVAVVAVERYEALSKKYKAVS
jgi:hypothetical protein